MKVYVELKGLIFSQWSTWTKIKRLTPFKIKKTCASKNQRGKTKTQTGRMTNT